MRVAEESQSEVRALLFIILFLFTSHSLHLVHLSSVARLLEVTLAWVKLNDED